MSARVFVRRLLCLAPPVAAAVPTDFDAARYRRWVRVGAGAGAEAGSGASAGAGAGTALLVMSYNLLSPRYLWSKVFGYLDQRYLGWEYRRALIDRTIAQFGCDIMCFQELQQCAYEQYRARFPLAGYDSVYMRKRAPTHWGAEPLEQMDGVGIFYNASRFEHVATRHIDFSAYAGGCAPALAARVRPRNTVAVMCQLYDRRAQRALYVANTHLYWSPQYNDVKLFHTKVLWELLAQFSDAGAAVVLCGDFNSTPQSAVCQLLRARGALNAYDGGGLAFSTYTRSFTAVLDHIWHTAALAPDRVLGAVSAAYLARADVVGFPNRDFPSDHLPLVAQLNYR